MFLLPCPKSFEAWEMADILASTRHRSKRKFGPLLTPEGAVSVTNPQFTSSLTLQWCDNMKTVNY